MNNDNNNANNTNTPNNNTPNTNTTTTPTTMGSSRTHSKTNRLFNTVLPMFEEQYIFFRPASGRGSRRTVRMMQVGYPGLCGVIFTFYNNVDGERDRRKFLANTNPYLLGKADGYRIYCVINRTREAATEEYLQTQGSRIASEMVACHLATYVDPVHLNRFRDLAPGELPHGSVATED